MAHHAKPQRFNPLQRFIRRILRWFRRGLGTEPYQPPGTLEGRTDRATLWRLNSDDPGVCACWQICHQDASRDLVISAISLAQLREELGRRRAYRRSTDPARFSSKPSFGGDLEAYLECSGGLDSRFISHIFVVVWRSRTPSTAGNNRAYLVSPVAAIPGDFQGVTNAWASGDRHAIKIAEIIARRLLRLTPGINTWEELIGQIDWLEWLEFYTSRALGQSHTFQPRRNGNQ